MGVNSEDLNELIAQDIRTTRRHRIYNLCYEELGHRYVELEYERDTTFRKNGQIIFGRKLFL